MLQQNFQTPEALGLTAPQHRALVLTLNALEREELRHVPIDRVLRGNSTDYTGHFNMSAWNSTEECGTVGCIGGTAELLGSLTAHSLIYCAAANRTFRDLLYPKIGEKLWSDITVDQAATALRSYLTTGIADWSHV